MDSALYCRVPDSIIHGVDAPQDETRTAVPCADSFRHTPTPEPLHCVASACARQPGSQASLAVEMAKWEGGVALDLAAKIQTGLLR